MDKIKKKISEGNSTKNPQSLLLKKVKEKFCVINLENLLLVFIAVLPILDMSSFLFRNIFNTNISPSTFIRPVVPIIAILIIFFKNKFKLKTILASAIYGIYGLVHMFVFYYLKSDSSYGSLYSELQYIMNYSYMVLNLFIYLFIFKDDNSERLKKYLFIANIIYIVSIYIAWITGTSSSTYVEGVGIKGWFESGNSLCSIFILSLFVILTMIKSNKIDWKIPKKVINAIIILTVALIGIFLSLLVGTRVGLFGFVLVLGIYILVEIIFGLKNKIHLNKKVVIVVSCIALVVIVIVAIKGSATVQRREYLKSLDSGIIDSSTGGPSHVTGDILSFKEQIESGIMDDAFLATANQKAIVSLYEYANKHEVALTDSRMQQIAYNIYLVKYQNNFGLMMFGNGYQANYAELILEMEIPAFLLNFGLIGFILYFIPFLALLIYALIIGINNIKNLNSSYVTYLIGFGFSFVLSFFAGYTFFNSSTMIVIIILAALLVNECKKIKS